MEVVNMHEAKTHLSKLVEKAVKGEPFIIARAGKPLVRVVALEPEPNVKRKPMRMGFMRGQIKVPDDFKEFGREEIEKMFYGEKE